MIKNDPYGLAEAWWKIFTKNYKPTLFGKKEMSNCKNCEPGCHCTNGGSCTSCECKNCECKKQKEDKQLEIDFEPDFNLTEH